MRAPCRGALAARPEDGGVRLGIRWCCCPHRRRRLAFHVWDASVCGLLHLSGHVPPCCCAAPKPASAPTGRPWCTTACSSGAWPAGGRWRDVGSPAHGVAGRGAWPRAANALLTHTEILELKPPCNSDIVPVQSSAGCCTPKRGRGAGDAAQRRIRMMLNRTQPHRRPGSVLSFLCTLLRLLLAPVTPRRATQSYRALPRSQRLSEKQWQLQRLPAAFSQRPARGQSPRAHPLARPPPPACPRGLPLCRGPAGGWQPALQRPAAAWRQRQMRQLPLRCCARRAAPKRCLQTM